MWKQTKLFFLFLFLAAASHVPAEDACFEYEISPAQEFVFGDADPSLREYLVNFAIESNDIYQTRTESVEVAQEVFAISDEVFEKGVIEVLLHNGEIVGFFTLKDNPPSDDWFQHELGHLFVKAGLQYQGFGTRLFHRAIEVARSKGWDKLEWVSDPDAELFYLKMGAKVVDHCENLLNPAVDLPIFSFDLTNSSDGYPRV